MYSKRVCISISLATILFAQTQLFAKVTTLEEIVVNADTDVKGKKELSIDVGALPASTHVITKEELEEQKITHYTELLQKTSGVLSYSMGQGDVADIIGFRGFTSDHSSQTAIFVDGVPMNVPHHSHAHGFADIGWIVPEMIERIEVVKGPFSALYGNFNLSGSINIVTKKSEAYGTIGGEAGSYGMGRGIVSYSNQTSKITPFGVYEYYSKDGYRDNNSYERKTFFQKLTFDALDGRISARVLYTKRDWDAPGYISLNDIKSGLIDRKSAFNNTDGGNSEIYSLVLNYSPKNGEKGLHGTLYINKEDLNRYSDFGGGQRHEHNDRSYMGWNFLYNLIQSNKYSIAIGTDGRYDEGTRERRSSVKRTDGALVYQWDVEELTTALFAQGQYKITDQVKLVGGARYDYFSTDITNKTVTQNSGDRTLSVFSPKVGIVYSPIKNLNIFANYGEGFRTPATEEMSPSSGNTKYFSLKEYKLKSYDVGFDASLGGQVALNGNYYWTKTEGEQAQNNSGDMENIGKTKREGFDIEAKWFASDNWTLFANYGYVKGRIENPAVSSDNYIESLPEDYIKAGVTNITSTMFGKLTTDVFAQRYGKTPLIANNSESREPVYSYSAKSALKINQNLTAFLEGRYIPNKDTSETSYYWGGSAQVDPKPTVDAIVGFKYKF